MRASRRRELPERPRLALVDVPGSPSVPEFRIVCARRRARPGSRRSGRTTEELDYDGSALRVRRRAASTSSTGARWSRTSREGDLTAAYRDGRVCVVNPSRARVANNKKLFALLGDPRFADLVEPAEARGDRRDDPLDADPARQGRATYGEWVVDLLDFVSDNRERLVLKPASEYGGHGVALGVETEQDGVGRGSSPSTPSAADFIVQEYVPVPEEMFPTVEDGHVQMRLKRFNINPFGIGGRYAGMITRISDRAVINVSAGGGLLPSVVGRHKRRLLAEEAEDGRRPHDARHVSRCAAATTSTRTRSASRTTSTCCASSSTSRAAGCRWRPRSRRKYRARRPPPRRRARAVEGQAAPVRAAPPERLPRRARARS